MSKSFDKWFLQLKDRPLPALAPVASHVRALLKRTYTRNSDFSQALLLDPGMAIEIFRSISRLPSKPREPIPSLSHAVAMLGLGPLDIASHRMPTLAKLPPAVQKGLSACYSRAVHAAHYALHWAELKRLSNPEEVAVAALVEECGEMLLWANAPKQMQAIEQLHRSGQSINEAAEEVLGFTLNDLSRHIATYWQLPPLTIESLGRDIFSPRPLCVMLASALARATSERWGSDATEEIIEYVKEYLPVGSDKTHALIHQQAAEVARRFSFTGLPLAILTLPMIPGDDAEPPTTSSSASLPTQGEPSTPTTKGAAKRPPEQPTPAAPTPNKASRLIHHGIDHLLQHLHKNGGLSRCMFAMRNAADSHLTAHEVIGNNPATLRAFNVELEGRNLLRMLLEKPALLWLKNDNRNKYESLIPPQAKVAWEDNDCLLMSLFVAGRPIGLFYADQNGRELSEKQYAFFKAAVGKLAQTLEQALTNRGISADEYHRTHE